MLGRSLKSSRHRGRKRVLGDSWLVAHRRLLVERRGDGCSLCRIGRGAASRNSDRLWNVVAGGGWSIRCGGSWGGVGSNGKHGRLSLRGLSRGISYMILARVTSAIIGQPK